MKRYKPNPKHKHILRQRTLIDSSVLKCRCGLRFEFNIKKFQYVEAQSF